MTKNDLIQILLAETKSGLIVWTNPERGERRTTRKGATITFARYRDGIKDLTVIRDGQRLKFNLFDSDPGVPEMIEAIDDMMREQLMANPPPAPPTFWQRLWGRKQDLSRPV